MRFNSKDFCANHKKFEYIHKQCISSYLKEKREEDIIWKLPHRQRLHLLAIFHLAPCSLTEFIKHVNLSKSAGSAAVDKLVKSGFVSRSRSENDKREIRLALSPKLKAHFSGVSTLFEKNVRKIFSDFSTKDIQTINRASEIIKSKLAVICKEI